MTDLLTEAATLEAKIPSLEKEAKSLEEQARAKRNERAECKARLSEIQLAVNRAVAQQAAQSAAQSAAGAQQAAEAAKTESLAVLDSLKAKSAELDALIAAAKKPVE